MAAIMIMNNPLPPTADRRRQAIKATIVEIKAAMINAIAYCNSMFLLNPLYPKAGYCLFFFMINELTFDCLVEMILMN
jgi:hypothetical protein